MSILQIVGNLSVKKPAKKCVTSTAKKFCRRIGASVHPLFMLERRDDKNLGRSTARLDLI